MEAKYKYVFGPVPSRRLGQSLGISPIPPKTCNYSCVYCQLGRTKTFTNTRQMFFPPEEISAEIKDALSKYTDVDFITFVGEGEPTLYLGIGDVIRMIRDYTPLPLSVITNGALLYDKDVRRDLKPVSVLMPTFDAPDENTWRRINRPHIDLKFDRVLDGLFSMKEEMDGEMWLEVMLVKGINDDEDTLYRMKEVIDRLKPHRVYINVPIRPPAEKWVEMPDKETLERATEILGAIPLGSMEEGTFYVSGNDPIEGILRIIKRHPMREEQIRKVAECKGWDAEKLLKDLASRDDVEILQAHGTKFYRYKVWRI